MKVRLIEESIILLSGSNIWAAGLPTRIANLNHVAAALGHRQLRRCALRKICCLLADRCLLFVFLKYL